MPSQEGPAAACPVDHKTREVWLAQARASGAQNLNPHEAAAAPAPVQPQPQSKSQSQTSSPVQQSCDSSTLDQSTASPAPTAISLLSHTRLGTDREVSTIPRALPTLPSSSSPSSRPANSERDTAPDKATGNWIYPSEQMFFEAMRRKAYDPQTSDMKTIVPIHNAVNERAWHEIKAWEAGRGSESCGGPKLASFSGLSTSLTPRARWRTWMGYQAPFDRHDWVVDRCGEKIEYVIDFYAGRDEGKKGKALNFHLDVRPKLNSFEGFKMRVQRFWGFGGA
ncbi:similar to cytochrome c1 heme lyase [Plenodomus lingam JN3]|uniref:Holocytochrome c-type synthase n=1 Tax=Leptosphaeria maculans (strain JN3 / isolate v23.1.3 / race Av1-4-5-6-7-8) TaxID=985895 RepID=E5R4X7_LEPMJ|nr:similar to cytochrome c1 heme lyase [Plenodomus lingam JN3]CBX92250.1 similar to cytochrome c1 heme lyase [Plenodomus lingam JN3]